MSLFFEYIFMLVTSLPISNLISFTNLHELYIYIKKWASADNYRARVLLFRLWNLHTSVVLVCSQYQRTSTCLAINLYWWKWICRRDNVWCLPPCTHSGCEHFDYSKSLCSIASGPPDWLYCLRKSSYSDTFPSHAHICLLRELWRTPRLLTVGTLRIKRHCTGTCRFRRTCHRLSYSNHSLEFLGTFPSIGRVLQNWSQSLASLGCEPPSLSAIIYSQISFHHQ